MRRSPPALAISLIIFSFVGCAMCDSSQDCTYSACGGSWQRADPSHGRVGSVFDPAEGVVPHDEPVTEEDAAPPNKQSVLVPEDTDSTDGEASNAEEMPAPDEEASEPANQEGPTTPAAGTAPATTDSLPPLELPSASPTEEAKPN